MPLSNALRDCGLGAMMAVVDVATADPLWAVSALSKESLLFVLSVDGASTLTVCLSVDNGA